MKYEDLYFIENTFWKSRLKNIDKIPKFDNIKYNDIIIFHFDFIYSIAKTFSAYKGSRYLQNITNTTFFNTLSVCLRYYELIKKLYPYNEINVIINTSTEKIMNNVYKIHNDAFKSVVDILPNFALIDNNNKKDIKDLNYFTSDKYKHILYGNNKNIKNIITKNFQNWKVMQGKLFIT